MGHEAMATMLAANGGVAVPEVLGVSGTERGAALFTTPAPGRTLDSLAVGPDAAPDLITDEVLAARLTHRQLDAHHFWVDGTDVLVCTDQVSGHAGRFGRGLVPDGIALPLEWGVLIPEFVAAD